MGKKIKIKKTIPGTIHYPGSCIQQNHGEILSHGYTVWDLPSKQSTYVEVPNDYGYVTIQVNNGKIIDDPNNKIPKKPRIRLKIENTKAADVKRLLTEVKQKYKVQDVSLSRVNSYDNLGDGERLSLGDIRDVEYQNSLIEKYINTKYPGASKKCMDYIRRINRITNAKLAQLPVVRNIMWKPKTFKFSNMFSYGSNNFIDFTNMTGTYGLFAPNASGKSSLLDSLAYCIFDKCSRSTKGIHVLNNKKANFDCEFNFEIKGIDYYIKRHGVKNKNGSVKVNVDFWRVIDGKKQSLNGNDRDGTNKSIRSYLGQYDDFILTALSLQNNNTGFIDMKQRDRKDLLSKFLDISIFEDLYQIASQEIKEVSVLLRRLKREDFSTKLAETNNLYKQANQQLEKITKAIDSKQKEINSIDLDYTELLQEFKTVDTTATDIDALTESLANYYTQKESLVTEISEEQHQLDNQKEQLEELDWIYPANKDEIISNFNKFSELTQREVEYATFIDQLDTEIKYKEEKLEKLEEHEYDPDCEYCINNVFVKDAKETEKQLKADHRELGLLHQQQEEIISELNSLPNATKKYEGLMELDQLINDQQTQIESTNSTIESLATKIEVSLKDIQATEKDIELYKQNEEAIKFNKAHQKLVDEKKSVLDSLKEAHSELNNEMVLISGEVKVYEKTKQDILDKLDELDDLEGQYDAYEKYLASIKRDGVPYELMAQALPKIEQEVNNILTQLVDFTILFETDGKNINSYIVYDDENYWPLELTSGMEKFVSSLAIRNSLISVSNLPRPSFIAIDEGLGNLDSTMLNSMFLLFDYLKSQFGFVILVSHIDATRDMVDNQIHISKPDGYSKIIYN